MDKTTEIHGLFRLGGSYLVDPARNEIRRGDEIRSVEPKVMEVLCFLAAHPGQVMSRQEIIDAVWGVAYGGDESLTRAVSMLRKALVPSQGAPEIIRTIPKRGYCLHIESGEAPPPKRRRRRLPWPALAAAALVGAGLFVYFGKGGESHVEGIVLLVKPLSGADLAGGELTAALAHFDQIRVRPYGDGPLPDPELYYGYVVSGSLADRRLRVQLQDGRSGDALWSGAADYAEAPDKAVATLAAQLELEAVRAAKLAVQKKPVLTLSPWELILLGSWVPGADREWPGSPNESSSWVWDRAIAKDPDFALAHASLAQFLADLALFDPPSDTPVHAARAAQAAERAQQLAPYDAGVLYQIGLYDKYSGKREEASAALRRVLELEPDNLLARIELDFVAGQCGARGAESLARLRALDETLSPDNPAHWVILSRLADLSLGLGDYPAARDYARRSRQIIRQTLSSITLAAADAELGETAEAVEVGKEHSANGPPSTMASSPGTRCRAGVWAAIRRRRRTLSANSAS